MCHKHIRKRTIGKPEFSDILTNELNYVKVLVLELNRGNVQYRYN